MANNEQLAILEKFVAHLEANSPEILKHPNFFGFVDDLQKYINSSNSESRFDLWPCLDDKTATTEIDQFYFYQDTWAAKKIFQVNPEKVVDIGSTALLVGIISQFCPTESIDVRPLPVELNGLTCKHGRITDLPLEDSSTEFISSMCVVEHVGLGRYDDEIDPQGSYKAFKEVSRVIKPGGHFVFSVPLSHTPGVSFNAHRIFSKQQVMEILDDFELNDDCFLFPKPDKEARVSALEGFQYCIWCAHMVKK